MERRKRAGIHFLISQLLDNGATVEELEKARKKYWAEYRKNWRRLSRQANKEVVITLNKNELRDLNVRAGKSKLSRSKLIKMFAFAYLEQKFIIPNEFEVRRLSQNIALNFCEIKEAMENKNLNFDFKNEILKRLERMEIDILTTLHNPERLENYLKLEIHEKNLNKHALIEFIKNIGDDDFEKLNETK